ncbi:conserved oligomeric Golgi complex subunit 7 [Bradysia coprophila]|uniref:conserved oligomeric Golgi complex subunit 7 n=1 Tax=Bradysia coprophila TaxID=38358 RepID=UPI00187D7FD5|nr:conserved oligomeric Golgi complex subunit 7 [Bradysia coprophila]
MDIEAFSDDNFDAIEWINKTYANGADKHVNKEIFVSNLVSKMQLYVQQLNSALEDTSQQVLSAIPKIMKDAQNLQNAAVSLKTQMSDVQCNIDQVQRNTGASMQNLERLDDLKSKLEFAKQGIQESDGWGRLTTELDELIEHAKLADACSKLQALQKSLQAQIGLPHQSDREDQVEDFKNRLEALASPGVVQSFQTGDIESSKKFVEMFSVMERLPQLTQYYRTVQKKMLQQYWTECVDTSLNSGSVGCLRIFYDHLYEKWQKESRWCSSVFGQIGFHESALVIIETLVSLQPGRDMVITNIVKQSNDKLAVLSEASAANVYFGGLVKRCIASSPSTVPDQTLKSMIFVIYDFFDSFVAQYTSAEQNNLLVQLEEFQLTHNTCADSVRALGNTNSKIFQLCTSALNRCEDVTQNCGLVSLVTSLNYIFKIFLDKYRKAQQQLHASRNSEQNWSLLQTCISLLQNIGDFVSQLNEFGNTVADRLLQLEPIHISTDKSLHFGYKMKEKRELNEFRKLIQSIRLKNDNHSDDDNPNATFTVFVPTFEVLKPICEYTHDTTLASIFSPIEKYLTTNVEPPESLNSSDQNLPDYSFAPQEFITQIGQYLLTLPQHLEPLLLSPSTHLKTALELCDTKYTQNIPSTDVLLSLLVDECCAMYEEQITQICQLSPTASKQIATDIEYLGNVLEELGLPLSNRLRQTVTLLRAPPETYLSSSAGCDPKLVSSIRQMRNIISG